MKTHYLFITLLTLFLFSSCEKEALVIEESTVTENKDEKLLNSHEFCTIDLSNIDASDDKILTIDSFSKPAPLDSELFNKIKILNPHLDANFMNTAPKTTKITLPDGSTIPLWQTQQYADRFFRHDFNYIWGVPEEDKVYARRALRSFVKLMIRPEFDKVVFPKEKYPRFKNQKKRIRLQFTKKPSGTAQYNGTKIRMGKHRAKTITYGRSRRIFAHELTHTFGYSHDWKMFKIEMYLANNKHLDKYKVYDLNDLFP